MRPKSLKQWIEEYENRTGDRFVARPDYLLYYLATKGFLTCKIDAEGSMLVVEFTCGNGDFWKSFAEIKAGELGLKHIGTFCNRNIKSYLRAFGAEILCEMTVHGRKRFICQDELGRMVIATFKQERGEGLPDEYYITLYLDQKASECVWPSWDEDKLD